MLTDQKEFKDFIINSFDNKEIVKVADHNEWIRSRTDIGLAIVSTPAYETILYFAETLPPQEVAKHWAVLIAQVAFLKTKIEEKEIA